MIYCLQNEIRFIISSNDSNFAYKDGWTDYFKPFCGETKSNFHVRFNTRDKHSHLSKSDLLTRAYKILTNTVLLRDLLPKFHNSEFVNSDFIFDKPEMSGHFLDVAKKIIDQIWVFQPHILEKISLSQQELKLPKDYYGIHIRGGDKITEAEIYSVNSYIEVLTKTIGLAELNKSTIYIATDDYVNIRAIKNEYPQLKIVSICKPTTKGHDQISFNTQTKEDRFDAMIELFTEIEILSHSKMFVGTQSSNIGMFMGMRIGPTKCKYVDGEGWHFWTV